MARMTSYRALGVDETVPLGPAEEPDRALLHAVLDPPGHGIGARPAGDDEVRQSETLRDRRRR